MKNITPSVIRSVWNLISFKLVLLVFSSFFINSNSFSQLPSVGLVKDINPGTTGSSPNGMIKLGSNLIYSANSGIGSELWKTDGTQAGTVLIKDINTTTGTASSNPSNFVLMGSFVYFTANDGVNGGALWRTDGTNAGTTMVKDIRAGATTSSAGISELKAIGTKLYFRGDDGVNGTEPWISDGTTGGTAILKNISPAGSSSGGACQCFGTYEFVEFNGFVYFNASDEVGSVAPQNSELWRTNGTTAGTTLFIDNYAFGGGGPGNLVNAGSYLFFTSDNQSTTGFEPWKTDGTVGGTTMIKDVFNFANVGSITGDVPTAFMNGYVYFVAVDVYDASATFSSFYINTELWRTDGTAANTTKVKEINSSVLPNNPDANPSNFLVVGNTLYFTATDGANGVELWKSDGTSANTVMIKDIATGSESSSPTNLISFNGFVYFYASNGTANNGKELWRTDGTSSGTVMVKDIRVGTSNSSVGSFAALNSTHLMFAATDGVIGSELYMLGGPIVTVTTSANGKVDPPGQISTSSTYDMAFVSGTNASFTFTPDGGNSVQSVVVDGVNSGTPSSYSFSNITTNHTLNVTFGVGTPCTAPSITTAASSNSPICQGANLNLSVTASGTAPLAYTWTGAGSFTNGGTATPTVSGASTGNYIVTVSNACGSTTSTAIVTVNTPSSPPTSITGASTICNGGSTTLTQSGGTLGTGASYKWYTGPNGTGSLAGTGASISVNPGTTTTYYVRAEGTCNTTTDANVTVTVNTLSSPPTSITGTSTICNGGSTTLTQSGGTLGTGASYKWYTGPNGTGSPAGTGASISVSPGTTTTYYVRAEGTCNNTTDASVTVTVNTLSIAPTSITGTSTICNGGSTTLTQSGGTLGTGASYKWYTGPNGTGSLAGTGASISVSPGTTTTYYVRAEGTCNNTTDASVTVTVNTLSIAPTSITGTSTICNGGSTTLTQSGGTLGTGASYKWYTGPNGTGSLAGTGASISVSPGATATYYVRAEGTCNTTSDASTTVTVNTLSTAPTSITGTSIICNGVSTTLAQVGGALGTGASYKWYSGSCGGTLVGTGVSISVSPSVSTTYYVRAEGACNSTACASLNVVVNQPSLITSTISTIGCYTWTATNLTYSVSGTYTNTFVNIYNCDSVMILNLTIQPGIYLNSKVILSGPYNSVSGLMNDSLRVTNLIPTTEPYTSAPYNKSVISEAAGETVLPSVLSTIGNNAIVDWIFIELRSASNPSTVVATKRALLQRDGDIVSNSDGLSSVFFSTLNNGDYYVSLKHRNHLGVMTSTPLSFNGCTPTSFDFTTNATVFVNSSIVNSPRRLIGSVYTLWAGDANNNKNTKYNGLSSDKDFILTALGGIGFINSELIGVYRSEDNNLDGRVKYNNLNNDRVVILDNVGVSTPNVILGQHTPN